MAYKAVNTLDSMIGHKDSAYFYFGKFAARLDDGLNFVPARLGAFLIVAAAKLCGADADSAFKIWRRDARRHASPNAGQTEAAMAGALNVKLGGLNYYDKTPHESGVFAQEFAAPNRAAARQAEQIVAIAAVLASFAGVAACLLINRRTR